MRGKARGPSLKSRRTLEASWMLALKGEQELIWRATELDMASMYYGRGLLKAEQYSGEFPSSTLTLMAGRGQSECWAFRIPKTHDGSEGERHD